MSTDSERRIHFQKWVLCCCPDKSDRAVFHCREQRILLRFRESMDLVKEQNGALLVL